MTYYYSRYYAACEKKYEWTAFTAEDFSGDGQLHCGDKLTMPAGASVCMSTYDADGYLSGDEYYNDYASDRSGQNAYIDGAPQGAKLYAESYHVLHGSDGKTYYLIEIEIEGCGSAGDYYTFYGHVPPTGTTLSVVQTCNVSGCMIDYDCLAKCEIAPPNTPPTFSNAPENCITVDENTTFVIDLDASDEDGDTLTYSIEGGADAALFEIDAETGELTFKSAPDYETPADKNGDNTYEVKVKVSDGNGGEETKLLKVCVDDVDEGGTGSCTVIEAEDMSLWGYKVESRGDASDGAGIVLCSWKGYASTAFDGDAGKYDLTLTYMDESDGRGSIVVYVNGCPVETICLNENDGGYGGDGSSNWSTVTIEDLALKAGDTITLKGVGDCSEYARIDKIEICQPACEPCVVIEAEDMWAYNFKTVCGVQASGNELVKLSTGYCGGDTGYLKTIFEGCDGTYNLKVYAQDEDDGQSTIIVKVNGVEVGTIILNEDDDGSGDDNGGFSEFTLEGIEISAGDKITLEAKGDNGEYVRIDKIQLCKGEEPKLGKIGDYVWFDADGDGVQDDDEAGVGNVTVTLLDGDGNEVATTATDSDGRYLFDDLEAGDYQVVFDLPAGGYAFTAADAGDDAADSDVTDASGTVAVTLGEGEENLTIDAGIVELLGSLSGRYFIDENRDGLDNDGSDNGVAGVTVELLDASGVPTGITTETTADGSYSFTGLAAGSYGVKFTDTVTGLELTTQNVDGDLSDDIDSDAGDLGGGMSDIQGIVVVAGADTPDNDAGVVRPLPASLGDRVWRDTNGNGIQDDGEAGVEGVTVTLTGAGADGEFGTSDDVTDTATTDEDGYYLFDGLAAGDYFITFDEPAGFDFTTPDASGATDAEDSDADTETGETAVVSLAAGEENLTVDAGLVAENTPPAPVDDAGKSCADTPVTVDVLDNDTDPDGDTLSVIAIGGDSAVGGEILLDGTATKTAVDGTTSTISFTGLSATLTAAGIAFDASSAFETLDIGEKAALTVSYTVSDGNGGTATADIALSFCGDANDLTSLASALPTGTVQFVVTNGYAGSTSNAYDLDLSIADGVSGADGYFDGLSVADAYCLSVTEEVKPGEVVEATLTIFADGSTDLPGTGVNGEAAEDNADLINWILNQDWDDLGYTDEDIQGAIWELTDDLAGYPSGTSTAVDAIVESAIANGEGFVPDDGQIVGILVNPVDSGVQPFVIGIAFDDIDCLC